MYNPYSYIDPNQCNSARSAFNACIHNEKTKNRERQERQMDFATSMEPLAQQVCALKRELQLQNKFFAEPVDFLKKENDQQKEQLIKNEKSANKNFWITTIISVASLVVAIAAIIIPYMI